MELDGDSSCDGRGTMKEIRDICIVAHVDHGKTTLADVLIASNGIISERLAGGLRYLDSREDEQERGITMKSSAITLKYRRNSSDNVDLKYQINLIDSPGHIDFASEVITALRLCDGCIVVVDCVEGMCPQTYNVLRQAWTESIKPVLLINKLDKLHSHLNLTADQATTHLFKLVEQINAAVGQFELSDLATMADNYDGNEVRLSQSEDSHSSLCFSPSKGNVVFASMSDKWAFNLEYFAKLFRSKLQVSESDLKESLWGDFYFNCKSKSIKSGAREKGEQNLFSKLVLSSIWHLYDSALNNDGEALIKAAKRLNVELPKKIEQSMDVRNKKAFILSSWLPATKFIFDMVIDHIPSPIDSINRLFPAPATHLPSTEANELSTSSLVVFVSKIVPVGLRSLPLNDQAEISTTEGGSYVFVGVARVFSGSLTVGQEVIIRLCSDDEGSIIHSQATRVKKLYRLMGRDLLPLRCATTGDICGIVADGIRKAAVIVDNDATMNQIRLRAIHFPMPIVEVAVEAQRLGDEQRLSSALMMLSVAEPCVSAVRQVGTNEWTLSVAGEVHLNKCLKDISDWFPDLLLNISPPTVPFRETIIGGGEHPNVAVSRRDDTSLKLVLTVRPLEEKCILAIDENALFFCSLRRKILENKEPLRGIAVEVDEFKVERNEINAGEIISGCLSVMRSALCDNNRRLMLATYKCDVLVTQESLGKTYTVIGRRFGEVTRSELREGSDLFAIEAHMPIIESFGFCEELRKKTSGLANAQFEFSHWQVIPIDPFWTPATEDELEEFGDKADTENRAKYYMNLVRRRKGLPVDEKVVERGEKQRTLGKNK